MVVSNRGGFSLATRLEMKATRSSAGAERKGSSGKARQDDPMETWSLGGPNMEAATGKAKETLKWRTRRTHWRQPGDSPDTTGRYASRSWFGGSSRERPRGIIVSSNNVGNIRFISKDRVRTMNGAVHMWTGHGGCASAFLNQHHSGYHRTQVAQRSQEPTSGVARTKGAQARGVKVPVCPFPGDLFPHTSESTFGRRVRSGHSVREKHVGETALVALYFDK